MNISVSADARLADLEWMAEPPPGSDRKFPRTCLGCEREMLTRKNHAARGLCKSCYMKRWRKAISAGYEPQRKPVDGTVYVETLPDYPGCLLWTGAVEKDGYGRLADHTPAHRYVYELHVGPIPEGLTLDHLCHTNDETCPGGPCEHRRCVNPEHLEPVTLRENLRRGRSPSGVNARKTHCVAGHELVGENVYLWRGQRLCRACQSRRSHEAYLRKKAGAND